MRNTSLTRRRLLGLALGTPLAIGGSAWALEDPLDRPARPTSLASSAALLDVAMAGSRIVAVGERGLIVTSDDHGRTWHQAGSPVSVTLTALSFADGRVGYAVGHSGVVLRTDDGGEHWARLTDGRNGSLVAGHPPGGVPVSERPWLDVLASSKERVTLVGAYGMAVLSEDGGRTWVSMEERIPNSKGRHLYALATAGDRLVICGEEGVCFAARGTGIFEAYKSPYRGSYFSVVGLGPDRVLLAGLRGTVYNLSLESGNWSQIKSDSAETLSAGVVTKSGDVVLVGLAGQVLIGGAGQASLSSINVDNAFPFASVAEASSGQLVLAGLRGLKVVPAPRSASKQS